MSVGSTLEEAFYYIHNLVTACEIQVSHTELHVGINDRLCVYLSVRGGFSFFCKFCIYSSLFLVLCVVIAPFFSYICIFDPS